MSTLSSYRNGSFPTDAPTQVPGISSIRRAFERRLMQVSNQEFISVKESSAGLETPFFEVAAAESACF
jgi:precorrin-6B methylase 1